MQSRPVTRTSPTAAAPGAGTFDGGTADITYPQVTNDKQVGDYAGGNPGESGAVYAVTCAEKGCEQFAEVLKLCRQILTECECHAGCPACVPPLPPGVSDEELEQLFIESNASVVCTLSLLVYLLDGRVEAPDVKIDRLPTPQVIEPPGDDIEVKKLNNRLERASTILREKRERLH